jgi:hypothetical protein
MYVYASKEIQLLEYCCQVLDRPERSDGEFESSGKLEVGHVSFNAIADAATRGIGLRSAPCEHMLGVIESGHGAPGLRSGKKHAASTTAQFEDFSRLPAEIDIEVYIAPRIVRRDVVVQLCKFGMSVVASFRGHSLLLRHSLRPVAAFRDVMGGGSEHAEPFRSNDALLGESSTVVYPQMPNWAIDPDKRRSRKPLGWLVAFPFSRSGSRQSRNEFGFMKGLHRLDILSGLLRPNSERSAATIVSPGRAV